MNEILRSPSQVEEAVKWLESRNLVYPKECVPKAWDQRQIIPFLCDGDILEMGCYSSVLMNNFEKLGYKGRRVGIDLRKRYPDFRGEYFSGDMLKPPFEDWSFKTIACLSVIEHDVDIEKFFEISSRLLNINGQLLLTFDYAEPKIKNYGTDTQPFCRSDVEKMIEIAYSCHLETSAMDYSEYDPVITWGNHAPHKDMSYSFGSLRLIKQ